MKISVIGAGKYGSTLVDKVARMNFADRVVMLDIVEGLPQGLALDMNQSRPIEGFETEIVGTNTYDATAGSDVVVVTAGKPRKPGMSRMDLINDNAQIVGTVAREIAASSPEAVVIVVSNPLDEMTALFQRVSGLPTQRVVGQAGMLDTARFQDKTAAAVGTKPTAVEAMTLGSHGDTMVPVPSRVRVDGKLLADVLDQGTIDDIVEQTRGGGAEVVALLKEGSAYFAPASAAARMVQAIAGDEGAMMPACAWVTGEFGISDVYLGVPVRLDRRGVGEIVEIDLTDDELADLRRAAEAVRDKQSDIDGLV
ncbi:malate dehydrogenase [Egibacter rhizosphaerae]|uniref:L-lactate dehydrogenase n=1 Tax=Egibacter rhizosphaerae TaxID=1670831 RepID=A0A411YHB9_9ACTN|nr:malate dehydrogenase [Egibacter rhizosphaerae]QBI20623.1 malate dehydrogenase [Egibacter rhizosphaerae]